jgi:phosphonate transport system permease protein
MIPPNWKVFVRGEVLWSLLETLSMAFVGTFLGVVFSFPLGLSAASNLAPSKVIREVSKGIIAAERAVPDLVLSLIFVMMVGFGPFAGMLAIAIGSVGMLGKLFADAIEEIDPKPLESVAAVGATKLHIIRYAVLPQVLPSFIANSLFRFDINIRVALLLGAVGGGGIGHELHVAMSLFRYPDVLTITVLILALILSAEKVSDYLRKRIIGQEVLQ